MEVSHSLRRAKRGWSLPWTWLTTKSKCLGSGMFVKLTLPWTWLNSTSKYLGSDMFTEHTLTWTLLTTMSKCIGPDWQLSPSALGLICLLDLHYLIPLGVSKEDGHSFRHSKEGYAFWWACQGFGILPSLACPRLYTLHTRNN
jgi:hypothetical protein